MLANTGVDQGELRFRVLIRASIHIGQRIVGPPGTSILEKRYANSIKKWLFERATLCLIFVSASK
jgi:hypothetical protein